MSDFSLASAVLRWQAEHGRHHLPWQANRDPYRVWLSEVMLQQTQVATVLGYFERFLHRFPDVNSLARADIDDVLALWSGLGYYSRARHLHRCAQQIMHQHGGVFPRDAHSLQALPGIGRSTAAAIASLCFAEPVAILDGNVKRVLARFLAFDEDLALAASERRLWQLATSLLPKGAAVQQMPRYTQGMMDLGATVCLPLAPACSHCPLRSACQAHAQGLEQRYPVKTRKLKRSSQTLWLLWAQTTGDAALWLQRRPSPGVWAGLYCLPVFDDLAQLLDAVPAARRACVQERAAFKHVLTHKDLYLHPVQVLLTHDTPPKAAGTWVAATRWPQLGLPAPVRKLLQD